MNSTSGAKLIENGRVGKFTVETTGLSYEEAKKRAQLFAEEKKAQDLKTIKVVGQQKIDDVRRERNLE
jgi:hypothetical protein